MGKNETLEQLSSRIADYRPLPAYAASRLRMAEINTAQSCGREGLMLVYDDSARKYVVKPLQAGATNLPSLDLAVDLNHLNHLCSKANEARMDYLLCDIQSAVTSGGITKVQAEALIGKALGVRLTPQAKVSIDKFLSQDGQSAEVMSMTARLVIQNATGRGMKM